MKKALSLSNISTLLIMIGALTLLPSSWAYGCIDKEGNGHLKTKEILLIGMIGTILLCLLPATLTFFTPKTQKIRQLIRYIIALIASGLLMILYVLLMNQLYIMNILPMSNILSQTLLMITGLIAIGILFSLPVTMVIRAYIKYRHQKTL